MTLMTNPLKVYYITQMPSVVFSSFIKDQLCCTVLILKCPQQYEKENLFQMTTNLILPFTGPDNTISCNGGREIKE